MKTASWTIDSRPTEHAGARNAWTAFWQQPAQSRCAAGAPDLWEPLTNHWARFATSLPPATRVLDLGCGAGAVARLLLAAREDVHVTGVDFARIPLTIFPRVELLSDTAMECLPFPDRSFGAVVSQFGYEYSQRTAAANEMARVLAPGARIAIVAHHSHSDIVVTNRSRLAALTRLLGPAMRAAFCAGDVAAFDAQMTSLTACHGADTLVAELARSLPSRLGRTQRERVAIWNAIGEALAPEHCIAQCLDASCVAPAELEQWLQPLRAIGELEPVSILREPGGDPLAWSIAGVCTGDIRA
jgi:SAM-dependent methyltransferase